MISRERNLAVILLACLCAALLAIGLSAYFDSIARLDSEFISLQKRALNVVRSRTSVGAPKDTASLALAKERFFARGALPSALTLAATAQAALESSGLTVLESKVVQSDSASQWIQYRSKGNVEAWFLFLRTLRERDGKALFRSLSLAKLQDPSYDIVFEVGHAVAP